MRYELPPRKHTGTPVPATSRNRSPGGGTTRRLRYGIPTTAVLVAALALAACSPHSQPSNPTTTQGGSPSSSSSPSGGGSAGGQFGDYAGASSDASASITFTASSDGISKLQGTVLLICTQTSNSGLPYLVGSTIPLNGSAFSSDLTTPLANGDSQEVNVAGTLDGSGHAHGTLVYKLISGGSDVCDTGNNPIDWTASIGGSTTPTTAANSSSCSPQPCSSSNGVTVAVTKLQNVADPSLAGQQVQLAVEFTVTNDSSSDFLIQSGYLTVQPGSEQAINPPLMLFNLPDGTTCDPAGDLPPGAHSDPQCLSIRLTPAQAAEPLTLRWTFTWNGGRADGTVDMSSLTIQ